MRVGLLGPARGDAEAAREAIEFLLGDAEVDQAIYLGDDREALDALLERWAAEVFGERYCDDAFLRRAAELAERGEPDAIEGLLRREAWVKKLGRIRELPDPPARAVEMIADRILLAVYDKSILDEEDIANAQVIVYGRAEEAELRRFGTRYFLTPGPLSAGRVAVLETEGSGEVAAALFETSGVPVWRQPLARRSGKVNVLK
ncbi:MAG: hypothetical protein KF729_23820 [Sandaracinaceae bacterium]|nr:hypothetical protein [Sandaracinaceae bacterium]